MAVNYYLCDNGYANSDGFLTPFKGVRFHIKEWGPANEAPQSPRVIFNMRHTRACNVIERVFAVLKMRWGILRSPTFNPLKVQVRLIMACFLLHNYVRTAMEVDLIEQADMDAEAAANDNAHHEFVDTVEPTTEWNNQRDALAQEMWNVVCFHSLYLTFDSDLFNYNVRLHFALWGTSSKILVFYSMLVAPRDA